MRATNDRRPIGLVARVVTAVALLAALVIAAPSPASADEMRRIDLECDHGVFVCEAMASGPGLVDIFWETNASGEVAHQGLPTEVFVGECSILSIYYDVTAFALFDDGEERGETKRVWCICLF